MSVAAVPVTNGAAPLVSELTPDVIPGNSATATRTPTNTLMMAPTKIFPPDMDIVFDRGSRVTYLSLEGLVGGNPTSLYWL